jgi:uncharacterized repeat protein (TIGR01451 family)
VIKRLVVCLLSVIVFSLMTLSSTFAQQIPYDISVMKSVRVNDGQFYDANDTATMPTGFLGDTVTWNITVAYSGEYEIVNVVIRDIIPAGFTIISTNDDTYFNPSEGLWFADNLFNGETRTLEIVTEAMTAGEYTNEATAGYWIEGETEEEYFIEGYEDDNTENNSDIAMVSIIEKSPITAVLGAATSSNTQVQPTATLSKTGDVTLLTIIGALFIITIATRISLQSHKK